MLPIKQFRTVNAKHTFPLLTCTISPLTNDEPETQEEVQLTKVNQMLDATDYHGLLLCYLL